MSVKVSRLLWVTIATSLIAVTFGVTSYQDWICRRNGQYNNSCNLTCSDGLARPLGCQICQCRESLCYRPDVVICAKGWHCEVQKSGQEWFPIDVPVCVPDEANNSSTRETLKTTTTSLVAKSTSTTQTTKSRPSSTMAVTTRALSSVSRRVTASPGTSKIPSTIISAIGSGAVTEPLICEQKGRCDVSGTCPDSTYVCRSDGKCCKIDGLRAEDNSGIPRCQQRPDFGYCRSPVNKHVFNIKTSRCIPIFYGGCGYSKNMFNSYQECYEICEKPCVMPLSDGPCRANIPRYYYDTTQRKCIIFDYGGCQGNENNFGTAEACEIQCHMMYKGNLTPVSSKFKSIPRSHILFPSNNKNSDEISGNSAFNSNTDKEAVNISDSGIHVVVTQSSHSDTMKRSTPYSDKSTTTGRSTDSRFPPHMIPFVGRSANIHSGK